MLTTARTRRSLEVFSREEFAAIVEQMVADQAPRLFAVVQTYGGRLDGRVAAWGMAFDEGAEVVSIDRGLRMSLEAAETAPMLFALDRQIEARLVWLPPAA
jgi:hypothetical protein